MQSIVLRPSYFMEVWLSPALGVDPAAGTARVYGPGDRPGSYISALDVAEFAVAAVLTDATEDEVLELGGPEALSQLGAIEILARTVGREPEIERVPLEALEAQHESEDPLQRTFAALMLAYAAGDTIPTARETAARFGIPLRSVTDHARTLAAGEVSEHA